MGAADAVPMMLRSSRFFMMDVSFAFSFRMQLIAVEFLFGIIGSSASVPLAQV